jgi:quercetin dioxygenase-like cupin family protein
MDRKPKIVPAEAGKVLSVLGEKIVVKVSAAETGGSYAVMEETTAPGGGPPPHIHHGEDEMFYVIEGKFEITVDGKSHVAGVGGVAFLPKDVPHSFKNVGDKDGRLLITVVPGGFEKFFEECDATKVRIPQDMPMLMSLAAKYKLEFLPPK